MVELAVEPVDEPAHLGTGHGLAGEELEASGGLAFAAHGLVEIFGDGVGAGNRAVGMVISTGSAPAGFSSRKAGRHSQGRSSVSVTSTPHSASARRIEREKGQRG